MQSDCPYCGRSVNLTGTGSAADCPACGRPLLVRVDAPRPRSDVLSDPREAARAFAALGLAAARRGDYPRAIVEFTRSLELEPGVPGVLNNRGFALSANREHDRAVADFDTA